MTIKLVGNFIALNLGHLQLVRGSQETEVQAPVPAIIFGTWDFGLSFQKPHAVNENSAIGDPATYSSDEVELEDGVDEEGAWSLFEQVREQLIPLKLPYDFNFNSNTYANTLLNAIDHSAAEFISYPTRVTNYPGARNDVAAGYWGLNYSLVGGDKNDVIRGGRGDDILSGGNGVDFLKGGKGSDILYAKDENGPDGAGDYLEGGGGRDTFHVGNDDRSQGLFIYDPNLGEMTYNEGSRGKYDLILDYSKFDKLIVTGVGVPAIDFSNFTVASADYIIDGKEIYFATSGDFRLSAIYDSYYDDNLGRSVDVMVFWYQILARVAADSAPYEVNTPLFAIETPQPGAGRSSVLELVGGSAQDDDLIGSVGDDTIYGGAGEDSISGEEGDDNLFGEAGDDDFYGRDGDGSDFYDGGAGTNSYIYEGSADLVINAISGTISALGEATDTFSNITVFYGSYGDDTLIAGASTRLFIGGGGFDTLALSGKLTDYRIYAGGDGYNIERAVADRDLPFDSRWLRLESIENVTFDGVSADLQNHVANLITGTSSAETLNGTAGVDVIKAGEGNDIINGSLGSDLIDGGEGTNRLNYSGNRNDYNFKANIDGTVSVSHVTNGHDVLVDIQSILFVGENIEYQMGQLLSVSPGNPTIVGTADEDALYGTSGSDTFLGNAGNDFLEGGSGSDIYLYNPGDGHDTIQDWNDPTSTDVLWLGSGIIAANVSVTRGVNGFWDIVLGFGTSGSVTIASGFDAASTVIEQVRFDDGTVWSLADIREQFLAQSVTSGADVIYGFFGIDDVIHGGAGNDNIDGFSGNDTMYGEAGDDVLVGEDGNDTLIGGTGGDTLVGNSGSDIYVYASGDGYDFLNDDDNTSTDVDTLRLSGLNRSDVDFMRSGVHMVVTILATNETIFVNNQFSTTDGGFWGVERIEFADGSFWNVAEINDIGWIRGTAGNDTLAGTWRQEFVEGGAGDDTLSGDWGSDTYIFNIGDGNDTIEDWGNPESVDVVQFGAGITTASVSVERGTVGFWDAVLDLGTAGSITIASGFDAANSVIEEVRFANGTTWTLDQLQSIHLTQATTSGADTIFGFMNRNDVLVGGDGNDSLTGFSGNDTLIGGAGIDSLSGDDGDDILDGGAGDDGITGGAGNDTFVFKPGFGIDWVADFTAGAGTDDVLEFDTALFSDFQSVLLAAWQNGTDTMIEVDANNIVMLHNVNLTDLHPDDVRFAA